ncbi:MAG TPA: rhodanese-like domain-containing protein [Bacillaceae bacterium]|nr:rhodanese-like domain-containing protein [Paenibacillus bovis]HLU21573.1 rhodanese-like domain-containing protein [Bacillaceae bacterium]
MPEFKSITPKEVENRLDAGETLHIIDVREDEEVAEGIIPGAVHIRMGAIPEHMDQLDETVEYIIVCRSGGRSGRVCEYLHAQGFDVTNMDGGMLKWTGEIEV